MWIPRSSIFTEGFKVATSQNWCITYEVQATVVPVGISYQASHHCSLQSLQLSVIHDDFSPLVVSTEASIAVNAGQCGQSF